MRCRNTPGPVLAFALLSKQLPGEKRGVDGKGKGDLNLLRLRLLLSSLLLWRNDPILTVAAVAPIHAPYLTCLSPGKEGWAHRQSHFSGLCPKGDPDTQNARYTARGFSNTRRVSRSFRDFPQSPEIFGAFGTSLRKQKPLCFSSLPIFQTFASGVPKNRLVREERKRKKEEGSFSRARMGQKNRKGSLPPNGRRVFNGGRMRENRERGREGDRLSRYVIYSDRPFLFPHLPFPSPYSWTRRNTNLLFFWPQRRSSCT